MSKLPVFVMVRTQLASNIGASARAMMNFGIQELRLVSPREDWLSSEARSMAAGADKILEEAKVFNDLSSAVSDLQYVYATSTRRRDMVYEISNAEEGAMKLTKQILSGIKCGVLFGPERTGLLNDELMFADSVIEVPLNPEHSSLNVSQAVLLIGYEYFKHNNQNRSKEINILNSRVAEKKDLIIFFNHLESELDKAGYFSIPEKRPKMLRNLKNIFIRSHLSQQEINTLHGVINDLVRLGLHRDNLYDNLFQNIDRKKNKKEV